MAACDTFRSGAVEQLRWLFRWMSWFLVTDSFFVKNPTELMHDASRLMSSSKGTARMHLMLLLLGSSKVTNVLWWVIHFITDLILLAEKDGVDVMLIDTAGRMQNNEPLMRSLVKVG